MFNLGDPTTNFDWLDDSTASTNVLFSAQTDGLNVPFFFVLAERGVPGQIYFGGAAELTPALGSTTFDPTSPYYNAATQFLEQAMAGQGVEVMPLRDANATTATFGLFVTVTPVAAMTQYQRSSTGGYVYDINGNPLPQLQNDGITPVTAPGVKILWSVRQLASNEVFNALTIKTVSTNGVTSTTYPIFAGVMQSAGLYGNRQGFSLFSTTTLDASIAQSINSVLYRFVPMELPTTVSTTSSPIVDITGATYNDVSFKNSAVFSVTNTNYGFNYVLGNDYIDNQTGDSVLPYNLFVYGANVATIGRAVLAVSPELGAIDPYLIDLISGCDLNGNPYAHCQIDPASTTVVNSAVVNYAAGGTDGDTSWGNLQTMIQNWLSGSDHGEFTNLQQHPMTHFSDPGFNMATKNLLFNMLDLRDNFSLDISTQDITQPANTKAQDISAGQALAARAALHPNSIIQGVGCSRVSIFAQAAELIDGSPYGGIIPLTYNRLTQRRDLDGGTYVKGSCGGRPNSEITMFRKLNWVADDKASQTLSWANMINAARHADRVTIFNPFIRTTYPNDTSLLVSSEFSDRICYSFKICREVWSIYAGVDEPTKDLFPRITKDMNERLNKAFSRTKLNFYTTLFQTAQDANLGYQTSANIGVSGTPGLRVLNYTFQLSRTAS